MKQTEKPTKPNVRHRNTWRKVEKTGRYHRAVTRELYTAVTNRVKVEVLDGILLNLNDRNQDKPISVQNRILRRIVEKRQAQANHRRNGRSRNRVCQHITIECTSRCMNEIRRRRMAV